MTEPPTAGCVRVPMHNPPHPGEFIAGVYLEPFGVTGRALARHLGVAPSTLSRVLNGSNRVSPEMALRLSKALGRSAESWLAMQRAHDLWVARQSLDLERIEPLGLGAA
jgi:addiction module HigA family antidote